MAKASNNEYPSVLFGEQSSNPSTPSAGTARLFVDNAATPQLKLIDDAATVTTFGSGGGGTMPGWLDFFVGTTDSTNFYWDDNDLSSSFTAQTVTGSATWTEGDNLVSVVVNNQTADDVAAQLTAVSFSVGDEWVVPIMGMLLGDGTSGNLSGGIIFSDGTATSSNCVVGHIQIPWAGTGGGSEPIMVGRHGTLTAVSTAPWVQDSGINWVPRIMYIKLKYQASNTFRLSFSTDNLTYSTFGESDISKTMTPTHVGLAAWRGGEAVDGLVTFGPLRKVA